MTLRWRIAIVELNHTIVAAHDRRASAEFLAEVLGPPDPTPFGPFMVVTAANGVSLDFSDADGEIARHCRSG